MTDPTLCSQCQTRPRKTKYTRCRYCIESNKKPCPDCGGRMSRKATRCNPCRLKRNQGPNHDCWKGGRLIDKDGYVRVWKPEDPRANCGRYMKEHTLVMEEKLGRQMMKGESVHHKN